MRLFFNCVLLSFVLVSSVFSTGTQEEDMIKSEPITVSGPGMFPIVNEQVTIDVLTTRNNWGQVVSFDDIWVLNWYEDLTGVNVNWQVVLQDSTEKVNLMLASRIDLPDVFLHHFTQDQILMYGEQGIFLPLDDMIDNLGFGVLEAYQFDPFLEKKITAPDGNIYSFFHTYESSHGDHGQKMWINETWLNHLGLEMPTTTDEFYQVLVQFRDLDANNNGDPTDEIPLTGMAFQGFGEIDGFLMNPFTFSPGVAQADRLIVENGKVDVPFTKMEYREGLRYLKKLWDEGLLDKEIFVQKREQITALAENPKGSRVGAIPNMALGWLDFSKDTKDQYTWVDPLLGPAGVRQTPYYYPNINMCMTITNECDIPEVAFRWGDGFYLRASNGDIWEDSGYWELEGKPDVAWRYAEPGEVGIDGKPARWYRFPSSLVEEDGGIRNAWNWYSTAVYKTSMVADPKVWNHEEILLNATWSYEKYRKDAVLPPLFMATNDALEIAELRATINDYVNESIAKFISGSMDLDSGWDRYVSELNKIGLERYLQLVQKSYDQQWK